MEGKKVIWIVNNKPRAFFYGRRQRRDNAVFQDNSSLIPDNLGIWADGAARRRCCVEQTGSGGRPTLGTTDPNFLMPLQKCGGKLEYVREREYQTVVVMPIQ